MAVRESPLCLTLPVSGDMTSNQYKVVTASTAGQATLVTTAGADAVGVLQDKSTAAGISAEIQFAGVGMLDAGNSTTAAIAVMTNLMASTAGIAIPATTTGVFVVAQALEALSSGSSGVIKAKYVMAWLST